VINFLNIANEQKHSRKLGEAATQGMWGFESGYDSDGDILVSVVDDTTAAAYAGDTLGIIMNYPVDLEGDEAYHDTLAIGDRVILVKGAGVEVEDDVLYANSTTADWDNASFGDRMCINTDGYLTLYASADADTGSVMVAEFMKVENEIIFYRTIHSVDLELA